MWTNHYKTTSSRRPRRYAAPSAFRSPMRHCATAHARAQTVRRGVALGLAFADAFWSSLLHHFPPSLPPSLQPGQPQCQEPQDSSSHDRAGKALRSLRLACAHGCVERRRSLLQGGFVPPLFYIYLQQEHLSLPPFALGRPPPTDRPSAARPRLPARAFSLSFPSQAPLRIPIFARQ